MNKMKTFFAAAAIGALSVSAVPAAAQQADAGAGANIIAPLQISKNTDLYFGTIAPSLTDAGIVSVNADGSRVCGPQLTCLTVDHTAANFSVTGETDASYTIALPSTIQIANGVGDTMDVYDFTGSKSGGVLGGGTDSFDVGGKLAVSAAQPAGVYSGSFTVSVEYQ